MNNLARFKLIIGINQEDINREIDHFMQLGFVPCGDVVATPVAGRPASELKTSTGRVYYTDTGYSGYVRYSVPLCLYKVDTESEK